MSDTQNSSQQSAPNDFKNVKYVKAAGTLSVVGGVLSGIVALFMLMADLSEGDPVGLVYLIDVIGAAAYITLGVMILKSNSLQRLLSTLRALAIFIVAHILVVIFGGLILTGELTAPGLIFIAVILFVSLAFRNLHEAGFTTSPAPFKAKPTDN